MHGLLPIDAISELKRAASVEPSSLDPLKRIRAIEQAIEAVKARYPGLFRIEEEGE